MNNIQVTALLPDGDDLCLGEFGSVPSAGHYVQLPDGSFWKVARVDWTFDDREQAFVYLTLRPARSP